MKRIILLFLVLLFSTATISEVFSQTIDEHAADGKIFVRIKDQSNVAFNNYPDLSGKPVHNDLALLIEQFGITRIYLPFERYRYIQCKKTYVFEFTQHVKVSELINALQKLNYVQHATKVPLITFETTPDDPFFHNGALHGENWHLKKINAEPAWTLNDGDPSVLIAVIDNEFDWQHPDLIGNIFVNPLELVGAANFDDDGNGFDDDVRGWDFSDDDNNTTGNNFLDHGTHVAGLVAATTNNNTGISSIGNTCSILPLKIASDLQTNASAIDLIAAIDAIYYADLMNARVISCSWTSWFNDPNLALAVATVTANNRIIVAAAGNQGANLMLFPAGYPEVIAVAATDENDVKASFSNFGNWIDVSAPGTNIYSLNTRLVYNAVNGYSFKSGTSMATPIVSGLCGLIIAQNPTFTAAQVEACLVNNTENINAQNPTFIGELGSGRIDAPASLLCASAATIVYGIPDEANVCTNEVVNFSGFTNATGTLIWNWNFSPAPTSASALNLQNVWASWATPGTVAVTLTVFDGVNNYVYNELVFVTVGGPEATFTSPTTFDLCNGSSQSLIIGFDNGVPPFDYTITNGYTTETFTNNGYTDYFYFYADPNYPVYTITSITDANGCTNNNNPAIALNIIPCCQNLLVNGDFEQGNVVFGSDNLIMCTPPAGMDAEGLATVQDIDNLILPNTFLGCSASVPTAAGENVHNAVLGVNCMKGPSPNNLNPLPFATPAAVPGYTSRLWFWQNINITNLEEYNIDFHTSGSLGGATTGFPFILRFEIIDPANNVLFTSGDFSSPTLTGNWHQFSYQWLNNTGYTGPVEVRLSQVTYFEGAYYDITFDDVSIRRINIPPGNGGAYAGMDISVCPNELFQLSGSGGPTYSWTASPAATFDDATIAEPTTSITATTNFVLTTNNACGISSDTVVVTALPAPFVNISSSIGNTFCDGLTTTLSTLAGQGTYLWSTGQTTNSITVTPNDTTIYFVTVTGANGCTTSDTITINVLPVPVISITASDTTICTGQSVTLTASGSTNYYWTPGFIGGPTYTVSPGSTTTYVLHETTSGCNATDTITITVTAPPTVSVPNQTICTGSSATLTATPSVTGGTYLWSNGATTQSITVTPASTTSYSVIYDLNGCTVTTIVTVTVTPGPTVTVNNDTICDGSSATLTATPSVTGGTFLWSNGATTSSITVSPSATTSYSVDYTLGGCIANATGTVFVNPMPVVTVANDTICEGSTATLTAVPDITGGTYLWTPTGFTTQTITGSPLITTTLNVTYTLNGCSATASGTVVVYPVPKVSVNNDTICAGGTATLTAIPFPAGGTYLWSPGGFTTQVINVSPSVTTTYTVTYTVNGCSTTGTGTVVVTPGSTVSVTDVTICNGSVTTLTATPSTTGGTYLWSPGGFTTQTISVSPSVTTNYVVTYSLGGCVTTDTATVTVNPVPVVTVNSDTICAGASTTLTATVDLAGGTYLWSNGATTSSITVSPGSTTTYSVTYTLNGCSASSSGTVTVNPVPVVSVNNDTICSGGSTTLTASPDIPGGTYLWSNGATTSSITVSPTSTTTYSVTYTVNGCSATASGTVTVYPNPTVTVNDPVICSGSSATIIASGIPSGGSYLWSTGATSNSIVVMPSTTTSYTVTYTLGTCSTTVTSTVTVNPNPVVTVNSPVICAGSGGTLTATASSAGGTYLWSTGATTASIFVTPSSTTSYTVTYTLGSCSTTVTSVVTVNPNPIVSVSNPTICSGNSTIITSTVSPTGGTYLWSTGAMSGSLFVTPSTTTSYTLTYTFGGCSTTATSTVTVNPSPVITSIVATPTALCPGSPVSITVNATGASTYLWTASPLPNPVPNNVPVISVSPTVTTTYTVVVTSSSGCTATGSVSVPIAPNTCTSPNTIFTSPPPLAGGTNFGFTTGTTIAVLADVTIGSGTHILNYNDIRFAPGKKIIVKAGATLVVSDAWLHGCATCNGALWGGIEVEHGATLMIKNYYLI
jgi:subtilisin family serine protease